MQYIETLIGVANAALRWVAKFYDLVERYVIAYEQSVQLTRDAITAQQVVQQQMLNDLNKI